jgi:hypothetical protein
MDTNYVEPFKNRVAKFLKQNKTFVEIVRGYLQVLKKEIKTVM